MREILFIGHRIPFPPDRGDKIRSHHILKRLARIAPVHVATFADDEHDMAEEVELASLASSYKLVRRSKPLVIAGGGGWTPQSAQALQRFAGLRRNRQSAIGGRLRPQREPTGEPDVQEVRRVGGRQTQIARQPGQDREGLGESVARNERGATR